VSKILVRNGEVGVLRQYPLDSRGWCLQESALPRRKLVFDECELSWSCVERTLCECGHRDGGAIQDQFHAGDQRFVHRRDGHQLHRLYYEWRFLVAQYSTRSLTKSTDKLIALSGLAKAFQRLIEVSGTVDGQTTTTVDGTAIFFPVERWAFLRTMNILLGCGRGR